MSIPVLTAVAWPYANGPRHIGHVSGFGVPSDVFSRYMRMAGHKVLMVSGTDEHGTPILVQADSEGMTARETADKYTRQIASGLRGRRAGTGGGVGSGDASDAGRDSCWTLTIRSLRVSSPGCEDADPRSRRRCRSRG